MVHFDTPEIYVNDKSDTTASNNRGSGNGNIGGNMGNNGRQCALDNKVFAEHFNLEDLSASFKSLYKSVFDQSVSSNSSMSTGNNLVQRGKKFILQI